MRYKMVGIREDWETCIEYGLCVHTFVLVRQQHVDDDVDDHHHYY